MKTKTRLAAVLAASVTFSMAARADTIEYVDGSNRTWYYTTNSDGENTVTIGRGGSTDSKNYAVSRDIPVNAAEIPWTFTKEGVSYTVTQISSYAFGANSGNNNNLTGTLTIPDAVTTIGVRAFQNCKGLTLLASLGGLTTISDYAFNSCGNMVGDISDLTQVTSLGTGPFQYCSKLTGNVVLCPSLKTISRFAFRRTAIESITIPRSVTTIGDAVFSETAFPGCLVPGPLSSGTTTIDTKNAFISSSLAVFFAGPNTTGKNVTSNLFLSAGSTCKVFVPNNGKWTGFLTGSTAAEVVYYGAGASVDFAIDTDAKQITATPTTAESLANVLSWAALFRDDLDYGTKVAITNRIETAGTVEITEAMLQNVTIEAPAWYLTFQVANQEQLDNVLAAVPVNIPIIVELTALNQPITVPDGREVAILAKSNMTFDKKRVGLVISFH